MTPLPHFLNKLALLKEIPIFHGLNWFELNRISRRCEIVEFSKGHVICQQGAPADAFYALISGRVFSYTTNSSQQKEEMEFILRGMHFGIISTLTGENHSHTYEAINDSVVLRIKKDDFSHLLRATPKLAVTLSQSLSKRIHSQVTRSHNTQTCKIIAVYGVQKGAGSSTYATTLAIKLKHETNKNVLLISLSSKVDIPLTNLTDIIADTHKINQAIIKHDTPVDILAVKFDPHHQTILSRISQFVSSPASDYQFIVVDLPNDMDEVVMKTLIQADAVHLITKDIPENLEETKNVIDQLAIQLKDKFDPNNIQVMISGIKTEEPLSSEKIKELLNYDVFLHLPKLEGHEYNFLRINENLSLVIVDHLSEYSFTIRRLARQISGVLVGLVLGGGAALGLAHVGVIRVLEREGIPIDIVVGSSMGALVASLWTSGYKAPELEKCAREFSKKGDLVKIFDPIFPIAGLVGGIGIKLWLKGKLNNRTFHETRIPLKTVAYDLYNRQELVIDEGLLVDAVQKSIAIPGVIRPVLEHQRMIIDGGVLNPLPTNVLTNMGIRNIIAVNVLQSPEQVSWGQAKELELLHQQEQILFKKHPWKFICFRTTRFFTKIFTPNIADIIVRTLQASEYILAQQSAKHANVVIHPDLRGINWFELYEVDQLILRGEEAALKALPQIKALIKN